MLTVVQVKQKSLNSWASIHKLPATTGPLSGTVMNEQMAVKNNNNNVNIVVFIVFV